ncbi:WecB/TagA/CpsF family glycosyltransferase [Paenibacillus sp. MMS20-IR301]|uniref:WecB/TagA/CpsF family glycosyltransferase n=1 Tax=Paenibacillus sp. MMS20-IR301 TaxID=2895946 RepID=UPI0028EF1769|nr:WecB/TagA/CpsF family glycosyltransferase [Paenibacillus sp. MMS20-IR301]WNS41342.1 WecB/TagA/CpsF family glycosyltransferase [Paenibacillus sp. MMS20-IR301]
MKDKVAILGIPFSRLTLEQTVSLLAEHVQKVQAGLFHLITANPEITLASQSDGRLREIIQSADLIVPDGIGIVLAARRQGEPIPERVTGYDLLLSLLAEGNERGWSFYFLGTDERTSEQAVQNIRRRYPQVKVAGRHHGFFSLAEEPGVLSEIQQAKPDVLILAMGAPYSDKWLHKHKAALDGVKVVFGVGGSLDVISGKVKPAPAIWKKLNLEWAHRLLFAPVAKGQKSRWRRQSALPKFVYRTIIRK